MTFIHSECVILNAVDQWSNQFIISDNFIVDNILSTIHSSQFFFFHSVQATIKWSEVCLDFNRFDLNWKLSKTKNGVFECRNVQLYHILSLSIIDTAIRSQFILISFEIQWSVWSVGFIMFAPPGTMWSESERFPIYRYPIQSGWKRTSKHVYWPVIQSVYTPRVPNVKASEIIVVKLSSFAVMNLIARMK